jgi:MFS-type transporter involved in bile tolerance (Atg22 family)
VGITGFSVGIFWPGTLSLAPGRLPGGGTAMYALLALAGDVGCSVGPSLVGFVSEGFGGLLTTGFAVSLIFPLGLVGMLAYTKNARA